MSNPLSTVNATLPGISSFSVTATWFPKTIHALRVDGTFSSELELYEPLQTWADNYTYATHIGWALYTGSCVGDNGIENCTAKCLQPDSLFSSLPTLLTCVAAGGIASHWDFADSDSQDIARAFGITADSPSANKTGNDIIDCGLAYLRAHRIDNTQSGLVGVPITNALGQLMNSVCNCVDTTLDSDLGGIGVLIAFILQPSLAIAGYVMLWVLAILTSWNESRQRSTTHLARHYIATVTALQEFLRTQCFFNIAVQIAALYAMLSGQLTAKTSVQYMINYWFIEVIAVNSVLSVPFTLWYLRQHTRRSWYSFLLSLVTFALGVATFGTAARLLDSVAIMLPVKDNVLQACGGFDPTTLCLGSRTLGNDQSTFYPTSWGISSVFMLWLMLDQLWYRVLERRLEDEPESAICAGFAPEQWWKRVMCNLQQKRQWGIRQCLWILFKLSAIGLLFYALAKHYVDLQTYVTNGTSAPNWTIGQIVGLAVWFQPVLEFVQVDLGGFKGGFSHRVPKVLQMPERKLGDGVMHSREQRAWFEEFDEFLFCATRPPRAFEDLDKHEDPTGLSEKHITGHNSKQSSGSRTWFRPSPSTKL